jgi:hypothetical protein
MMMKRRIALASAAVALTGLVLAIGACTGTPPESTSGSGAGAGSGTLRVLLTDKPFPIEFIQSAIVTLTRVEVRKAETTETESETNTTTQPAARTQPATEDEDDHDDDGSFITIFEDAAGKSFDLITLRNGRTNLLADVDLPAGTYTQMRLVVTAGEVTLTDGRTFPLKVPSGEQSGIKLNFTFEVKDGEQTDLLLDVDLSRAFKPIPGGKIDKPDQIKQFHFSPSVAMRLINLLEAGSISGMVTDAGGNPVGEVTITAYQDETEVTTTTTEADGTYMLVGLTTGTYKLVFSATGYADAEAADIAVEAGKATLDVNVTLTAEAAPAQ